MTIRWGIVMVPVSALEATSNAFVGHHWGIYKRERVEAIKNGQPGTWRDVRCKFQSHFIPFWIEPLTAVSSLCVVVAAPALRSAWLALAFEVPLCLIMTFAAVKPFAYYLSGSEEVAIVTTHMWRTIDWVGPFVFFSSFVTSQFDPVSFSTSATSVMGYQLSSLRCFWLRAHPGKFC